jgi:hypothetical protein
MTIQKAWIAGVAAMILAASSQAASVTVNFDDASLGGPQTGVGSNYESQGFRFSPCTNYGIVSSSNMGLWTSWSGFRGYEDSQFFAFQAGNGPGNPEYLGSAPGCTVPRGTVGTNLYIDRGGATFSLHSLYVILGGFNVTSSRGGSQGLFGRPPGGEYLATFSGAQWENLEWVSISIGVDVPLMIDQISFGVAVPEPDSSVALGLVFASIFGLASSRRRRLFAGRGGR